MLLFCPVIVTLPKHTVSVATIDFKLCWSFVSLSPLSWAHEKFLYSPFSVAAIAISIYCISVCVAAAAHKNRDVYFDLFMCVCMFAFLWLNRIPKPIICLYLCANVYVQKNLVV